MSVRTPALLAVGGLVTGIGLVTGLGLAAGRLMRRNMTYAERDAAAVRDTGFTEKRATVNGSVVNYAEGPAGGPPLLLVHGQAVDWRNWSRVLPGLARHHHVFAIDCYGHGASSRVPAKYTANALAADAGEFLRQVVGGPATVAGHSSGGLIAAGLAANAPELVTAVVLEDPPFFSSVPPRSEKTFNQVSLATTAHAFLASGERDFVAYQLRHDVFWDLFKDARDAIRRHALKYRRNHPGEPVRLFYMPPVMNEMLRGMESYDPRFGEAFYTGAFHDGFDHADVLARIRVPSVLIHTNWSYDEHGVLLAAMNGDDARRARTLLRDVRFYKVDSGHGFHFEKPTEFRHILRDLRARLKG